MLAALRRHAALFAGVFLVLSGFGLVASLVGVELARRDLTGWVGWVGAAYFVGLGIGSVRGERTIAEIGYLRAYGLLTAGAAMGLLLLVVTEHPAAWLIARTLQGFALGGLYVCIESWLGSSTAPDQRGRVLGIYQVVVYLGLLAGQALYGQLGQEPAVALAWGAIFVCAAALPVGAVQLEAPTVVVQPRLGLGALWDAASLGVIGVVVSGLTTGSIYAVAPAAGVLAGMSESGVAWWMAALIGGGMVLQLPIARASDAFDRRLVLAALGALAAAFGLLSMAVLGSEGALLAVSFLEGGVVFAFYTVALAYTFDRVPPERAISANATLLACFCAASAAGSGLSSAALAVAGPVGFFAVLAAPPAVLAAAAIWRAQVAPPLPADAREHAIAVPPTSAALVELDPRIEPPEPPG